MKGINNMIENQIIEILGSQEKYIEYKNLIIQALKRELDLSGIATCFDDTAIFEQFADFYLQGWLFDNEELINRVRQLKDKNFTQDEIRNFIEKHPIIPEDIESLLNEKRLIEMFGEGNGKESLNHEDEEKINDYMKNPELLSEEDALSLMKDNLSSEISQLMECFGLQSFKNNLDSQFNIGFLHVNSNPKDFDINRRNIKSILKGNTKFNTSHREQSDDEQYDFEVNSEQIVIIGLQKGYPIIEVYIPDKEYPEGTLRSTLIQKEKEDICEKELRALYLKFQGQGVDFSKVYQSVMAKSEKDMEQPCQ